MLPVALNNYSLKTRHFPQVDEYNQLKINIVWILFDRLKLQLSVDKKLFFHLPKHVELV